MLLPTLWLHDYCDPGLDVKALEERLTMTGTYVERLYAHGVTALENFVVGRVLSAEQHPDADRLTVCMVALGEGDTAQIVCGAPNVAEGQTVAVARPGAVMPGGVKLKKAKLRGRRVRGHDPGRGRGRHRHAPRRDHGARRRPAAGDPARGRAPDQPRTCSSSRSRRTAPTA